MSYTPYYIGSTSVTSAGSAVITTTNQALVNDTILLIAVSDTFLSSSGWSAYDSFAISAYTPLTFLEYTSMAGPCAQTFVGQAQATLNAGQTITVSFSGVAAHAIVIAVGIPNCTAVHTAQSISGSGEAGSTSFGLASAANQAVGGYFAFIVTNPIEAITAISSPWTLSHSVSNSTIALSVYTNPGTATGTAGTFTIASATAGLLYGIVQIYPSLYAGQVITIPPNTGSKVATQIKVTGVTSPTVFSGTVVGQPLQNEIPGDSQGNLYPIAPSSWSALAPVQNISGLDYLAGKVVNAFVDGSQQGPFTVSSSGTITLTNPGANVIVGLSYSGQVQTLRLELEGEPSIQGDRKTIPAAKLVLNNTLGVKAGQSFATLDPVVDTTIPFNSPQLPISTVVYTTLVGEYESDGQVCIQQDNPLPCTILAIIPEVEIGDTQK